MDDSIEESSQVDLEREACVASLKNTIQELPEARTYTRLPSICRVSHWIRKENPEAYEPKVVSLGPLHHGKANLIPMEKIKLEILRSILHGQPNNTLDLFFNEVFASVGKAREAYSEKIELTDGEFAQMLVIDGCFFIVLCCWAVGMQIAHDKTWNVPLMSYSPQLLDDIWLLENQLPFFVVSKLFQKFRFVVPDLRDTFPCCTDFLFKMMGIGLPQAKYPKEEDVLHLLHLLCLSQDPRLASVEPYQQSCWGKSLIPMKKVVHLVSVPFFGLLYLIMFRDFSGLLGAPNRSPNMKIIWTATELQQTGIKFHLKPTKELSCYFPLDISFRDGKLEIPEFSFDNLKLLKIRNLIAFEQSSYFVISSHMTHYCILLANLINTVEDVRILRESGVLLNDYRTDFEFVEMVNSLCKEVFKWGGKGPYDKLFEDIRKFCQISHNKRRADLVRNYFYSPWKIFVAVAAIIPVVFTITETLFTIYPRK